jgi:hypothetical protein
MNASQSGSSLPRILGGLVILLVAGVLLYYLYDYWYNIGGLQQKAVIIPNPMSASSATAYPPDTDTETNLRDYIFTGGELSTSFWVYVTGMTNYTDKKHLISLEEDSVSSSLEPTLLVALGSEVNKLYVRVRSGDTSGYKNETFMSSDTVTGSDALSKGCNVNNFESGRWVNVVIILNNTISDVYVDGKLASSCKLPNQWKVPSGTSKLRFKILQQAYGGKVTGFTGSFSNFVYYNYALSPDQVYRIYMAGPSGGSVNLWEQIKRFFGASKETTPVLTSS